MIRRVLASLVLSASLLTPADGQDGYQILLWRQDGTLLGRMVVWQLGEKMTGDFINGVIDAKGVYFTVPVVDEASPGTPPLKLGVKARIEKDRLNGLLWWDAENTR